MIGKSRKPQDGARRRKKRWGKTNRRERGEHGEETGSVSPCPALPKSGKWPACDSALARVVFSVLFAASAVNSEKSRDGRRGFDGDRPRAGFLQDYCWAGASGAGADAVGVVSADGAG